MMSELSIEDRLQEVRAKQRRNRPPVPVTPEVRAESHKQIGMALAEVAAGTEWVDQVRQAIHQYLLGNRFMFIDDLREWDQFPPIPGATEEEQRSAKKAIGTAMHAAAKSYGWCRKARPTGDWPDDAFVSRPSVHSNGSPKPLWESLLYRP